MASSMPSRAGHVRWWWIVLTVAIGVLLFAATGITQGACYDSADPLKSYCTSEPTIPVAAAPYVWGAYLLPAGYLIFLALRRRQS